MNLQPVLIRSSLSSAARCRRRPPELACDAANALRPARVSHRQSRGTVRLPQQKERSIARAEACRRRPLTSAAWLPIAGRRCRRWPRSTREEAVEALLHALHLLRRSDASRTRRRRTASSTPSWPRARPRSAPLKRFITQVGVALAGRSRCSTACCRPRRCWPSCSSCCVDMDTEYERDPQRKLQILAELETPPRRQACSRRCSRSCRT